MRENCLSQLQKWVTGWKDFNNKGGHLQIKIAHGEPLTLCNCVLPENQRFDFIHTSRLCDDVGLMNLLLSCSHRLKRGGLLTVQTNKWTDSYYTSFEDYLQDNLKAGAGFYPTLFGLQLAEDFTIGTCNPHRPNVCLSSQMGKNAVTTRWRACSIDNKETVDIQGSLELLNVFKLIVDTAFDYQLHPVMNLCGSGLILPLTVIYLIRSLQYWVKGGAESLLDIVERRLPVTLCRSGQVFKPSESEWRELRHQFFPHIQQPKSAESLIVVEFDEFYNPKEKFCCPAGIRRPHQLFVFNTIQDKMSFITTKCKPNSQKTVPTTQPFAMSTLFKYEPTRQTLSFLCPRHHFENFGVMMPLVMETFHNTLPTLMCRNCMYDDDTQGMSFDTEVVKYNGFDRKTKTGETRGVRDENDNIDLQHMFKVETCEAERYYTLFVTSTKADVDIKDITGGVTDTNSFIVHFSIQHKNQITEEVGEFNSSAKVALPVRGNLVVLHKTKKLIRAEIEKDLSQLVGPHLLTYRRIEVSSYPKLKWDLQRFGETVNGMFDTTRQMQKKGMLSGGTDRGPDYFLEFKNTLQIIFLWVKNPPFVRPKVCSYSLIRDKRMVDPAAGSHRDQECGKYPDEIFLAITGEHEVDGKLTLKVVWIDFEIYNRIEKEGKVAKGSHLKFMRKYWYDDEDKNHPMGNSAEAARMFQTMLRVNSLKCSQGGDEGFGVWNFTSFLQPVYTVGEIEKAKKPGMFKCLFPKMTHPLAIFHTRCHVCGTPVGRDVKECSDCEAVQYCSQACCDKDYGSHQIYCNRSAKGQKPRPQFVKDQVPSFPDSRKKERCSECQKKKTDLKKCSRCKMVAYCNQACQKKHWPKHKKVCQSS